MPQRVYCSSCKATLYNGLELESPTEIIQPYNGECPKCQKPLKFEPEKVKISEFEGKLPIVQYFAAIRNVQPSVNVGQPTNTVETTTRTTFDDIQKTWHYKDKEQNGKEQQTTNNKQ